MKTLEFNTPIRNAIEVYNNEFAHKLNAVKLSFSGSKVKGYQLYFKDANSGKIECSVMTGNRNDILTAIQSIYQFSGNNFNILKN